MQSRHTLLSLIILGMALMAIVFFNPFGEEIASSPFALAIQDALNGQLTVQPELLIATDTGLDDGRYEEIVGLLNKSKTGQATLSLINQYEITIHITADQGSRFNPNTNQIFINISHDPVMAALILVHEATHARYLHEGSAADVRRDSRESYVAKKVQEEATAVANSIEAKMELEAAGVDTNGQQTTLELPYRQAYEMAIRAVSGRGAGVSTSAGGPNGEAAQASGRTAARQTVLEALINGKAVTSTTKQTYPFYWGKDWDIHHVADPENNDQSQVVSGVA